MSAAAMFAAVLTVATGHLGTGKPGAARTSGGRPDPRDFPDARLIELAREIIVEAGEA